MNAIGLRQAMDLVSFWPLLVNTLAVLSTVVVASLAGEPLAVIAPLVPMAVILWRQRRALLRAPWGVGGMGRYQTARYLLIAAATVHLCAVGELRTLGVTAFVLAVAALAAEPLIRSVNGLAVPYAAGFPARTERNRAAFPYGWMFSLDVLALLALLLASISPPVLIPVAAVLSLFSIGGSAAAGIDIIGRIRARRRFQAQLPQILESMAPQF